MLSEMWNTFWNLAGLDAGHSRRKFKPRGNWGIEGELLEGRALLSATGPADVAADVVATHHKASFTYPDVAGQWHFTGQNIEGDATMSQTKNNVTADITVPGMTIHLNGKFTKKHTDELMSSTKVDNPKGNGKVKVSVDIHFLTDTTFNGNVNAPKLGLSVDVAGTKTPVIGALKASRAAKAAPTYPDISGQWDGSVEGPLIGVVQATLNLQQNKARFSASANLGNGISVTLKGKLHKADPTTATGKAHITTPMPGFQRMVAPFNVQFLNDYTEFDGVAHSKFGEMTLHANRVI